MKYSSWDEYLKSPLSPGAAAAKERLRINSEAVSRGNEVERTWSERPFTQPVNTSASSINAPSQSVVRGGLVACVHQFVVVPGKYGDAGACERPKRIVCKLCSLTYGKRCKTGSAAKCATCARIHSGDIRAIGRSGWTDRPVDRAFMLTLTAPGADLLPWDKSQCRHSIGVPCEGSLGCKCEAEALAEWHGTLPRRWSDFMTYLRRELGIDVQYLKTYEPQQRDALHVHAMVRVNGVCTDRRLRAAVRLCAHRWEFGRKFDLSFADVREGLSDSTPRAAGYVAKYVAKSCDALSSVAMKCADGEVRCGRLRAWSASRRWGITMKHCEQLRVLYMRAGGTGGCTAQPGAAVPAPQAPDLTSKGIVPQTLSEESQNGTSQVMIAG